MTPAEILLAAAARIREVAQVATKPPWVVNDDDGEVIAPALDRQVRHSNAGAEWFTTDRAWVTCDGDGRGSVSESDAAHIALWHPGVALAVADWLDAEAVEMGDWTPTTCARSATLLWLLLGLYYPKRWIMGDYKISTEQSRHTGDINGIAIVERLDRIVELLEQLAARALLPTEETE